MKASSLGTNEAPLLLAAAGASVAAVAVAAPSWAIGLSMGLTAGLTLSGSV